MDKRIDLIVSRLSACPCVLGIVLGGSRATGVADSLSDMDIGVYYDRSLLDLHDLCAAAQTLDDLHRENLICPEGGWGNWVNCGGWLTMDGLPVDLILRDLSRVQACIDQTDTGEISAHYQPGHPHAYLNVMYRGELAASRTLFSRSPRFDALKERSVVYPDSLREALIRFYLFEAGFSLDAARHNAPSGDSYYLSGHLFRTASSLNQVLFALNRAYCLNEKKAILRIGAMPLAPGCYPDRIQRVFHPDIPTTLADQIDALSNLLEETKALVRLHAPSCI